VPRLFERVRRHWNRRRGSIRKKVFFWAKRVGEEWTERTGGKIIPMDLRFARMLADRWNAGSIPRGRPDRIFVGAHARRDRLVLHGAGLPVRGCRLTDTSPVVR
jgi:hypothetical protein